MPENQAPNDDNRMDDNAAARAAEAVAVRTAVRRFGWNATSSQVLEPAFAHWWSPADAGAGDTNGDAGPRCVAYVDTGAAWVAAGAPLAEEQRLAPIAHAFIAAARAAGRRACFFATEQRFALHAPELRALLIGEQPIWDPSSWPQALASSRDLREQLRRARAKGVTVRPLAPDEVAPGTATRAALEALIARWQRRRPMPPMGFLVAVHLFDMAGERRLFVAEVRGEVRALLAAVPVHARNGWLFEDLIRDPAAPNGCVELLVDHAMRACARAGSSYVTLGLSPLSGAVPPWLRSAGALGAGFFDFAGLRAWKAKMRPHAWDAIYLVYPDGRGAGLRAVADALAAFAHGGLLRFGLRTLLRGPAVLIRLLAFLLVPWTLLLALPVARPFFPSRAVQLAWVALDLGLLAGFAALMRRWRTALGTVLALAVTADAVVTAIEAAVYNLPRVHGPVTAGLIALAVTGPALAAVLLWGACWRTRAST